MRYIVRIASARLPQPASNAKICDQFPECTPELTRATTCNILEPLLAVLELTIHIVELVRARDLCEGCEGGLRESYLAS